MDSQHDHVRAHYAPRAHEYLTSPTHAAGPDLDQIEAAIQAARPTRVLDLGCGGGHVAYRAAAHAPEIIACDVTGAMLEVVRATAAERGLPNITTHLAAAEQLGFPAGHFGMVVSRFSAHHWTDLPAGLREAARVLAPAGRLLIVDTIAPAPALLDTHMQTIELLRDPAHVRNYTAAQWVAALAQAGLCVTGCTPRRLRMEFAGWVARTRTDPARIAALLAVQQAASAPVQLHFAIEPDGSWVLDTLTLEAGKLAHAPGANAG